MNYLNELKTNPSNPRLIKKDQFERLKKSIGSFTKMLEVRPIAYDSDGVIWGGNMRYEALIIIHTYPENNEAWVDVGTCDGSWDKINLLADNLGKYWTYYELDRTLL